MEATCSWILSAAGTVGAYGGNLRAQCVRQIREHVARIALACYPHLLQPCLRRSRSMSTLPPSAPTLPAALEIRENIQLPVVCGIDQDLAGGAEETATASAPAGVGAKYACTFGRFTTITIRLADMVDWYVIVGAAISIVAVVGCLLQYCRAARRNEVQTIPAMHASTVQRRSPGDV